MLHATFPKQICCIPQREKAQPSIVGLQLYVQLVLQKFCCHACLGMYDYLND